MRPLALLLTGLAFALVGLIAFLPARVVSDLALRPAGVEADLVTGPVWNARLYRVAIAGQSFAEGTMKLAFFPLLTGAARVELALVDESASARGTLIARPGSVTLEDWTLAAEARRLPGLADLPVPQDERLYAEIDRLRFEDGECAQASGTVSSGLLARLGQRYELELPQVEGTLGCAGQAVGIGMDGASEALDFTGSLRLDAQGYRWHGEARSGEPGVIAVLIALGFEEVGAAWRAEGEGRYR